jgi:predicted Zn-dependent protease
MEDEVVEVQEEPVKTEAFLNYRFYLRQRPVMLGVFLVLAIVLFLMTSGLARLYRAQREALGTRWFTRGVAELNARNYDAAAKDFRAALLYSRDNYAYQLDLAEALLGQNRSGQASAYLLNLWDREPEDGLVNLELARIAKQKGQVQQAVRYYHNAVYAAWPGNQENKRLDARLELIELLLGNNERAQAESEVLALEANVGDDPALQAKVGDLFVRTLDYERAFTAYRASLKADRHNQAAMAGAGQAAFELGRYPEAYRYLQEAVAASPSDTKSAALLTTAELVLKMDPFRRQLSAAQRARIVVDAFSAAGQRLQTCGTRQGSAAAGIASLSDSLGKLKPQITELELQRKPDLVETAMDLVFNIERQTSEICGPPSGTDQALLLIAKLHEGIQ